MFFDSLVPGYCNIAPLERDRFGWISRQNRVVLKNKEGVSRVLRFDLVEEDGRYYLTGEVRSSSIGNKKGEFKERTTTLWERLFSLLGIPFLLGIAWLISVNRGKIRWKTVLWGVGLQVIFALIILSPGVAQFFFNSIDTGVKILLSFSEKGAEFVFQATAPHLLFSWDPSTNRVLQGQGFAGTMSSAVKTFTFWILPTIIFFSSLMTVLYHLGIMQKVVKAFAWAMQKTMKTSGSETLSAAANIFVGQTEAPLVVKPFVANMTNSELHAIMVGGFATVAGGVMAAYVGFLRDIPGIAGHLVTASIMSAPAALAVAKIIYPETEKSATMGGLEISVEKVDRNVIEAAARGATEGMTLLLNVVAMLVAFVGLMAMINYFLGMVGTSLQEIFGYIFWPFAFMMGVPADEAMTVGSLLGEKIVLTEFVAYLNLGHIIAQGGILSARSAIIASYALCGFSNFASIGIQLGGIGGIAPGRRGDLAKVCLRAMFGGFLAANMTATIAGIIL
ncbi:MAG: NupC/NupG family nucleoside CNT transporter [Deltaproteobacteria bacterium]|nr:NupC/NupG family nucleoside CNT transporter [Deltaproteobacteria bacterium]